MRVGDLVRFKKELGVLVNEDLNRWIGLVIDPCVEHQVEGTVAMIQWMCNNTPTPEYVEDLEVICE